MKNNGSMYLHNLDQYAEDLIEIKSITWIAFNLQEKFEDHVLRLIDSEQACNFYTL